MTTSLADMRQEYRQAELDESSVAANPFEQFEHWWQEAQVAQLPEPNAMTLATVDEHGEPAARIVLLKGFDQRGLVFYTNYESHKGADLAHKSVAAAVFWWHGLERQVRVKGAVEKTSAEQSDDYFHSRPRASQLGAVVSQQSQVVANRELLAERYQQLEQKYVTGEVPRPQHWGGYRIMPTMFEFWQGRRSRLHDRLCYRLQNADWLIERLQP